MGATADLAAFVVSTKPEAIPDRARSEAKRAFIDVIGTALAGSMEPTGWIMAGMIRREAAPGAAAVIGQAIRTGPSMAALANGTMGHALDFDDIGLQVGHPTVAVAPAAMAVAEEVGASGAELLDAMVIGYEVASRIGRAAGTVSEGPYRRGYHGTSVYGVFGATAAAARLLGLEVDQTRHAFGIAASEAGGVRANFGTMTKPLHAGETNRAGVMAAMLARDGFTANVDAIEFRYGWNDAIASGAADLVKMTAGLGDGFAIEEGVDVKLYPCCGANHAAINALRHVMGEHGLTGDDIAEVAVEQSAYSVNEILIYPWPATGLEGKFSLAYNMAATLADGTVKVSSFSGARFGDVERYRDRVVVRPVDEGATSVVVHVRTADGRELVHEQPTTMPVQHGGHLDPLSEAELHAKFRENAKGARTEQQISDLLAVITTIDTEKSLEPLTSLLL